MAQEVERLVRYDKDTGKEQICMAAVIRTGQAVCDDWEAILQSMRWSYTKQKFLLLLLVCCFCFVLLAWRLWVDEVTTMFQSLIIVAVAGLISFETWFVWFPKAGTGKRAALKQRREGILRLCKIYCDPATVATDRIAAKDSYTLFRYILRPHKN